MAAYSCAAFVMLVSIITPTTLDRKHFNNRLSEMVKRQTYQNIEHIFDYSDKTIGAKLNNLCEQANGDIIIRKDSDDFYAPDYVSQSLGCLVANNAQLVGLSQGYFYDMHSDRAWLYRWKGSQKLVLGATQCFTKEFWQSNHFDETVRYGEDNKFCARCMNIAYGDYLSSFVAVKHGANTSPYNFKDSCYTEISAQHVKALMI